MVKWLQNVSQIVMLLTLLATEINLELVLEKNFKVQFEYHKYIFRRDLFLISVSLICEIILDFGLEDWTPTRMPKTLPTLAIPIFVITFFKSTYNCFDCFNKFGSNADLYIYSIYQIDRTNSIYLRGRNK